MLQEGNQIEKDAEVEALRLILEAEQHRPVTYGEAQEVAESLISFFEVLAEGKVTNEPDEPESVTQNLALELAT